MTALGAVVAGLIVVALDLRIDGFDVLPDPAGWVLVIMGLNRVRGLHRGFQVALGAAVAGLVASLPQAFGEPDQLLTALSTVISAVLTFAVCTALMTLVPPARTWADRVRWADVVLSAISLPLGLLAGGTTVGGAGALLVLPIVAAAIAVFVAFLLLLWRHRHQVSPDGVGAAPLSPV